ncbi:hypothetical protein CVT25_014684 [Psilocybe cyanescens]|uniref:Uncharacterized protein n=1 Tax=Psilocybe cyanescens TaxID=93625 RepID=A0A409WTV2_PSICY|nr:hypothetical protein CVT25_014684 [Psilocybe cyanescens]
MSSKARLKSLADEIEDAEVAFLLEAQSNSGGDNGQWSKDKSGDLDWGYTARNIRAMSHDELLTDLWKKGFSIPPREYNPSAPFVYVKMNNGEVITLPHGYRLPLMFVARYYWGITLSKVGDVTLWKKERANVYHLSRLCENLFQRARAKAFAGGMEKGWRCVMFDRLLARFYKSWYRNDPAAGKEFETKFSVKEYDRDVLKHDWKRWCTRGLNGVRMKEQEVSDGITLAEFRAGLQRVGDGEWTLHGERLAWIADDEGFSWSSESELTEFDLDDEDEDEQVEEEEEEEDEDSDADAEGELVGDDDDGLTIQPSAPPDSEDAVAKRVRDLPIDEDDNERASKRARIEMISDVSNRRYKVNNIVALTRTLAAMEKNPVWARHSSSGASGSGGGSQLPTEAIDFTSPMNPSVPVTISSFLSPPPLGNNIPDFSGSIFQPPTTPGVTDNGLPATPSNRDERPDSSKSVVVISKPTLNSSIPRRFSSLGAIKNGSSVSASSSKLPSSSSLSRSRSGRIDKETSISSFLRPSGSKPRQTRASRIAGVATVNVYVSDGKPRGGAVTHAAARAARKAAENGRSQSVSSSSSGSRSRSRSPTPSVSQPNPTSRLPPPPQQRFSPLTEPTPTEATDAENPPPTQIGPPPAKWSALPAPPPPARSVSRAKRTEPAEAEPRPTYSQEFITSEALKLLVNLVNSSRNEGDKVVAAAAAASSSSTVAGPSTGTKPMSGIDYRPLEGRFQHFEEQFLSVKEELVGIVERLQVLEKEAREQRKVQMVVNERVFCDQNVGCTPDGMSQSVQTDQGAGEDKDVDVDVDVHMGGVEKEDGEGGDIAQPQVMQPLRVMGEIAVQTEPVEEELGRSHASVSVQSAAQQDADEGSCPNQNGAVAADVHASDRNCGSETDTDSTLNAAKDEPIDPRASEMSSNLSLLVNNLVSVKMLSLVGDMVKGKTKETSVIDPDASIRSMSPAVMQASDSFALSNLFEEVKAMKDEARAREHRDKEEMLAMRQLHSAEVDALRRRLSYLESQNRYLDSVNSNNDRHRSSSAHSGHGDGHGGYHISTPIVGDHHSDGGRHSRQRNPYSSASARIHHSPVAGEADHPHTHTPGSSSGDRTGAGASNSSSNLMPTPAHSERSFSFTRPGGDRDEEIPLPIKSQRKHNMFVARATFG